MPACKLLFLMRNLLFSVGSSWSSAPTLVERQRENLTERLRREFGLFVDDEEAERARKQGEFMKHTD